MILTLYQENRKMAVDDNQLVDQYIKQMDYVYDLVSGNVNRVSYQHGKIDQFHHVYKYDADNRITQVFTTETTPLTSASYDMSSLRSEPSISPYWHKDASYSYYRHGPLARTELGSQQVQGLDYVYTIQGWLKGVNATDLSWDRGYAADGLGPRIAKDVFSYGLHYFDKDYKAINSSYQSGGTNALFAQQDAGDWLFQNSNDLYNGNIARMVTTITDPSNHEPLVLGNAYKYDQLNRIINSISSTDAYDAGHFMWNTDGHKIYQNTFTYDANGNILTQVRGDENNTVVDDLNYGYQNNRNRLIKVGDQSVAYGDFSDDIDESNYKYDAEGRLISDSQEEIDQILWRVDGKVKAIIRAGTDPSKKNLIFDYEKKHCF